MTLVHHLTLRQLRVVLAVHDTGRLGGAAQRLHVTESAVSAMLRQAEGVLKVRLFERTTRSLRPTAAAGAVVPIARQILAEVSRLGAAVAALDAARGGVVQVATTPAVAAALMPACVRRFRERHPDIGLVLTDCAPDQLVDKVLAGECDFGIGTPDDAGAGIELRALLDGELCLVCSDDHPLAGRDEIAWAEVGDWPLIAVRAGYGMRSTVERLSAELGIELKIVEEVSFLSSAMWMTASGLGVSIWSSSLVSRLPYDNLVRCRLSSPTVITRISTVHRRGQTLSPAAQAFLDFAGSQVRACHDPRRLCRQYGWAPLEGDAAA